MSFVESQVSGEYRQIMHKLDMRAQSGRLGFFIGGIDALAARLGTTEPKHLAFQKLQAALNCA